MSNHDVTTHNASDDDDFEHRLKAKLNQKRLDEQGEPPSNLSQGLRYGSEFIGGILVGTGLGLAFDWVSGWSPWGLLVGLMLGFAAGTLNVVRAAQQINRDNAS